MPIEAVCAASRFSRTHAASREAVGEQRGKERRGRRKEQYLIAIVVQHARTLGHQTAGDDLHAALPGHAVRVGGHVMNGVPSLVTV